MFFKALGKGSIYGIETRSELVESSKALAQRLGFDRMQFLNLSVAESAHSDALPEQIDVVTALHACDTATDDAMAFGLQKKAKYTGQKKRSAAERLQALLKEFGVEELLTQRYPLGRSTPLSHDSKLG